MKLSRIADSTYLGDHSLSLSCLRDTLRSLDKSFVANSGGCVRGIETIFFSFLVFLSLVIDLARCVRVKFGKEFELPVRWFYMEIREYLKRDRNICRTVLLAEYHFDGVKSIYNGIKL